MTETLAVGRPTRRPANRACPARSWLLSLARDHQPRHRPWLGAGRMGGPSATGDLQQGHLTQTGLAVSDRPPKISSGLPICGGEDRGSQFIGVPQSDQVPAGNDHGFDTKSFAGQLLLKLQREEAVVLA